MSKTKTTQAPTTPAETELPEGWVESTLDHVGIWQTGGTPSRKQTQYFGGGIPWVKSGDLSDGLIERTEETISAEGLQESAAKLLPKGAVSVALYGATIGKLGVFGIPAATNQACANCIVDEAVANRWYVFYYLLSQRQALIDAGQGGAQPNLTNQVVREWTCPLAPLPEQQRIVAKVEALLEAVNAARARLARLPAILKRFRQSVLAAACSGQLTAEWREGKNPEPAAQLLMRLRETPPTKAELNVEFPVRQWRVAAPRQPQPEDLPSIPETWAWVYLPDLGYMNRGRSRNRPRNAPHLYGGKYPFIQTGDIAQSGGRIVSHKQTYSEAGLAQSRLWPAGTICITIAANIADSAILTYPACFPDSVVGLITDGELCVAEFAEFFIRTAREDLSQFAPATAQKNINIGILGEVAVPLPPLDEQREIVRRVEALFALADGIEAHVRSATVRAERLPQAILARAFRGELVPTEAELARAEGRDYEPASVLLERIQEAQARYQPAKRGRGAGSLPTRAGRVARKQCRQ